MEYFVAVQSLSRVRLFVTPWNATPDFPVFHYLPEIAQIYVHGVSELSNHLTLFCLLLLLPSTLPSIRVFSNESAFCIRWPNYWSFSFSISSSNENSGLISFRIDWFALLAVQGTLISLLQHHILSTSILWCSAFFIVPTLTPMHDYWKNHSFDYMDFVGKVMSLLFNTLFRLVIVLLPRSKRL